MNLGERYNNFLKGDNDSLIFIINHLRKKLLTLSQSICLNKEVAEDIVSDIVLVVFDKRPEIEKNIESYLVSAVRNNSIRWIKKQHKILTEENIPSIPLEQPSLTERENIVKKRLQVLLREIKEKVKLTKGELKCFLIYWQNPDLTYEELSEEVGIKYKVFNQNMYKSKKKVKEYFDKKGH